MLKELLYRVFAKYEIQLQQIKEDRHRLKMKESMINKVGQVLVLHLNKWRQGEVRPTNSGKSKELAFVEKYIGQMGEKSPIELTKPFGYRYDITKGYLKDYRRLAGDIPLI